MRRRIWRRWNVLVPLALLLVASVMALRPSGTHIVAYFPSATGLYKGDPVKVMGVAVGKVRSVEPEGDRVRVELEIGSQPVPAAARAAIVAPSLVSERFVQLAPAYTRGNKMRNGGVIPLSRTAVPVSFDDVKRELTDLATALGPAPGRGAETGSLNQAIRTLDANLSPGAAAQFRDSMTALRGATASLASGGDDLFTTLRNLNAFVENLGVNDKAARDLTVGLARYTGVLDDNKQQLRSAVAGLDEALKVIRQFVGDNADVLDTGVRNLEGVARTLASRSDALATALQVAPNGVTNLYNMVQNQAVTARLADNNIRDLSQLLCGSILGIGGTVKECKAAIAPLLETLGLRTLPGDPSTLGKPSSPSAPAAPPPLLNIPHSGLPLLDGLLASLTGGAQ
ncbi:phospholipid/cholesterol/gamma-HCH transport system substrate-binding protein [Marmoricola sp. URHA0025 HA25]